MASQAELQEAARQYRAEQLLIATVLARDLLRLFRNLFSVDQPEHVWPEVRTALGLLIRDRRVLSARSAGAFYQRVRQVSGLPRLPDYSGFVALPERPPLPPRVKFPDLAEDLSLPDVEEPDVEAPKAEVKPPRPLEQERLDKAVDGAGIATYKKALRTGATPFQARDRAGTALSGTATRLVLEGGRSVVADTVTDDDDMLGWVRVTDADPCSWCAMLASRPGNPSGGVFYKSEQTAGRAKNAKFEGLGEFKFHDHCGCIAVPVRTTSDPHLARAEELYDEWKRATAGTSGKNALNAWRRHWDSREAAPAG